MTDTEKLIKNINSYLTKLSEKQLRTILLVLYEFTKAPAVK